MKVLGVVPGPRDIQWALLDGSPEQPTLIQLPTKTQRLPNTVVDGQYLRSVYKLVRTFFQEQSIERVCLLQALNAKFRASPARIKIEAVVQMAADELGIPAATVAPQTLRAREKRFGETAGDSPEAVFNNGTDFTPKPWRDAVLVAWVGLLDE